MENGSWIDKLMNSVGKNCNLITHDGIERGGRLSGFEMRSFTFNNQRIDVPTEIELNGDPSDTIPLERISKITVH